MITDADVRRISEGTGRPVHDFVRFVDEDDVEMTNSSPWWIRFDRGRTLMTVRWTVGSRCVFLQPDERCGIYEHRPHVCRAHPFTVTLSDTGALEKMSMSRVVACPAEWDGRQSRREIIHLDRWGTRETDVYLAKVKTWNRDRSRRRVPNGFLRHLGLLTPDA
jgi:Fe-S-cluster containining protein